MSTTHTDHPSDDERLQDLLDGRLDEAEEAALRARIEADADLREAWEELRGIQALVREYGLSGADAELPDDFLLGVRARIGAGASVPETAVDLPAARRRPGRMLHMLTVAYAAAALLVVGFTVRYVLHDEPRPAGEVRTAEGPADRQVPPEARAKRAKITDDGTATEAEETETLERLEKEGGSRAGGLGAPEPSRAFERKSPRPQPGTSGAKDAGPFRAPGGMVPPGVRPLPGSKAKPAPVETAQPNGAARRGRGRPPEDARARAEAAASRAKLLRLLEAQNAPDAVYVLEVEHAADARRELALLLAAPAAPGTPAGEPDASPPSSEKAEGSRKRDGKAPAPSRLYRVEGAAARRLLASLQGPAPSSGKAKGGVDKDAKNSEDAPADASRDDDAEDAGLRAPFAFVDLVTPEVDAAALARLDRRVVAGVWGADGFAQAAKKAAPPTPRSPSAPTTPQAPAPRKPAGDDAPAEDADADPATAPRAKPSESTAIRRVRILIVERR